MGNPSDINQKAVVPPADATTAPKPGLLAFWVLVDKLLYTAGLVFKVGFTAALFSIIGVHLGRLMEHIIGMNGQGPTWGWFVGAAAGLLLGPFCRLDFARSLPDVKSQPASQTEMGTRRRVSRDSLGRREFFRPALALMLVGGTLGACLGVLAMTVTWSIMVSPWAPPGWGAGSLHLRLGFGFLLAGLILGALSGIILAILHLFRQTPSPKEAEDSSP